jgi:L-threonylcarbamoyladenylate synthase
LREAGHALTLGGVIAFPTETFYGLGVAALDAGAVGRLLALKGRPADKPILVLVDSVAMADALAEVTSAAQALIARHWPGALTLVMRARAHVPAGVTAGTGTVGVRMSPHPVACGLVQALGGPITAPSANPAGAPPPTIAAEVVRHFDRGIDLVLDGGPTPGGAPSTVLDVTVDPPRILRAGAVRL